MERRPRPVRRLGLVAAALVLASGLAACGGTGLVGEPPAATYEGHRITAEQVRTLAQAQIAFLRKAQQKGGGDPASTAANLERFEGDVAGFTLGSGGTAQALNTLISLEASKAELRALGTKVSKAERDKVRQDLLSQVEQQYKVLTASNPKTYQAFVALIDAEAGLQANLAAIGKASTSKAEREKTLRSAYETAKDDYTQACIDIIQVQDQATAQKAYDRVAGGEDFVKVATEVSDVKPTPGQTAEQAKQCYARADLEATLGRDIYTAEKGDLLEPVQASGSQGPPVWVVVQVSSLKVPTFDDIRAQLDQAVPAGGATSGDARVTAALKHADITVDPKFGTWDAAKAAVVPPA